METWSFIGSDKNAGKTTALNFVHKRLHERGAGKGALCLTSIGINGEPVDNYENRPKPRFPIYHGEYVVSAVEHFENMSDKYLPVERFVPPDFGKTYLLAKVLRDMHMVVEGPNDRRQLLHLKERLKKDLPISRLLIDGSIDRQFIAHPKISDAIFFSLLITDRIEQRSKARDFLSALQLPGCSGSLRQHLEALLGEETRSLLMTEDLTLRYRGSAAPFHDEELKKRVGRWRNGPGILYLNGALTRSLFDFLADLPGWQVVLDNFTLYQNVSVHEGLRRGFAPRLCLLYPVSVKHIFIHRTDGDPVDLPTHIPVTDLVHEDVEELIF